MTLSGCDLEFGMLYFSNGIAGPLDLFIAIMDYV